MCDSMVTPELQKWAVLYAMLRFYFKIPCSSEPYVMPENQSESWMAFFPIEFVNLAKKRAIS